MDNPVSDARSLLSKGMSLTKDDLSVIVNLLDEDEELSFQALKVVLPILATLSPPPIPTLRSLTSMKGSYIITIAMTACEYVLHGGDAMADTSREVSRLLERYWADLVPWSLYLLSAISLDNDDFLRHSFMGALRSFLLGTFSLPQYNNPEVFFGDGATALLVLRCIFLFSKTRPGTVVTTPGDRPGCFGVSLFLQYAQNPLGKAILDHHFQHDSHSRSNRTARSALAHAATGLLRDLAKRAATNDWPRNVVFSHSTAIFVLLQLITFDQAGWICVLSTEAITLLFECLFHLSNSSSGSPFDMDVSQLCHQVFVWIRNGPTLLQLKLIQALTNGHAVGVVFNTLGNYVRGGNVDTFSIPLFDLQFLLDHTSCLLIVPRFDEAIRRWSNPSIANPVFSWIPGANFHYEMWQLLLNNISRGMDCLEKPPLLLCDNIRHNSNSDGVQSGLRTCSGCHSMSYCSAACQREDWVHFHQAECKALGEVYKDHKQRRYWPSFKSRGHYRLLVEYLARRAPLDTLHGILQCSETATLIKLDPVRKKWSTRLTLKFDRQGLEELCTTLVDLDILLPPNYFLTRMQGYLRASLQVGYGILRAPFMYGNESIVVVGLVRSGAPSVSLELLNTFFYYA